MRQRHSALQLCRLNYGAIAVGVAVATVSASINAQPATRASNGATLTVAPTPFVRIGSDVPGGTFTTPYAARLASGAIATLDAASRELRIYTADGRRSRLIGKAGPGPGEFQSSFIRLSRVGDSLIVIEHPPAASQAHVFAESGFVRRESIRSTSGPGLGISGLAYMGGSKYLASIAGFRPFAAIPMSVTRDSVPHAIISAGPNAKVTRLGSYLGNSVLAYEVPGERRDVRATAYVLGPSLAYAGGNDIAWVGDAATGIISLFSADGASIRSFEFPVQRKPYNETLLSQARVKQLADVNNEAEKSRINALYDAKRGSMSPAFSRFVISADSLLWVELFREDEDTPPTLVAVNRQGRLVARMTMPMAMRVDEVGSDYVIGVATVDGEPEVRAYRTRR